MKRVMNSLVVRRPRIGCARHSTSRDYFLKNPEKKSFDNRRWRRWGDLF
jgi:hypothetical protein